MLHSRSFRHVVLLIVSVLSFMSFIARGQSSQPWSPVLAPARATNWSQAGISGGIPSTSWTQCGPTIAPYSGSPATIINALNHTGSGYTNCAANQYVQLGAGTFSLSGSIRSVGVSNAELRGMGANQTHLVFSGASTCQGGNGSCLVGFESSDSTYPTQPPANIYNWTSGYAQGTSSITLSSGAGITANSTVLALDQCDTGFSGSPCSGTSTDNGNYFECSAAYSTSGPNGCSVSGPDTGFARTNRFQLEFVQATSCSPSCGGSGPTTVTIKPALQHPNWTSGQTPQVWLFQPASNVGFRNFSIDGAGTSDTAGVSLNNCVNCWATGIAVLNSYNMGIWLNETLHADIESNYVFNAGQNLNYADPTGIKYNGSNNLIANNIVQAVRPAIMAEGTSNGSVIAYNFTINSYTGNDYLFGGIEQHSAGDDFELYEGNITTQMMMDQIHGAHLSETSYRNLFTGWESCANGNCGSNTAKDVSTTAVDVLSYDRYANFVANVLGTPGVTSTYQSATNEYIVNDTAWVVGSGNQGGSVPIPLDPQTGTTLMRWGNYDVANGSVQWNTKEVPSGISFSPNAVPSSCTSSASCPASFYLSSRPAWWSSSLPFPAIGPDVSGGNLGVCAGTLNASGQYAGVAALTDAQCKGTSLKASQWGGHVNAIPALSCYLNVMNGPPDGSGGALNFNATSCYSGSSQATAPAAPSGLSGTVQ
jgi:hypothetical protein